MIIFCKELVKLLRIQVQWSIIVYIIKLFRISMTTVVEYQFQLYPIRKSFFLKVARFIGNFKKIEDSRGEKYRITYFFQNKVVHKFRVRYVFYKSNILKKIISRKTNSIFEIEK